MKEPISSGLRTSSGAKAFDGDEEDVLREVLRRRLVAKVPDTVETHARGETTIQLGLFRSCVPW